MSELEVLDRVAVFVPPATASDTENRGWRVGLFVVQAGSLRAYSEVMGAILAAWQ